MRRVGLLLVDAQVHFLSHPALVPDRRSLAGEIGELLLMARKAGAPVFHVHTVVSRDGRDALPHWRRRRPLPCTKGSRGARPEAGLEPLPGEFVTAKTGHDAFAEPDLATAILERGVRTIVLAGVHTHACIREAALGARAVGLRVVVARDAVASYDPVHADRTLDWLQGRVASCAGNKDVYRLLAGKPRVKRHVWVHRDPLDARREIFEVKPLGKEEAGLAVRRFSRRARTVRGEEPAARAALLASWERRLRESQAAWVNAIVRDLAKPVTEAEAEVDYGLALLEATRLDLTDDKSARFPRHVYKPVGTVAVITPWNNPFAVPVANIAAALAHGNRVEWKPALAGSGIARLILPTLGDKLGRRVELVLGGSEAARGLVGSPQIDAVIFTGSSHSGRSICAMCARDAKPLRAELGGNNAAVVMGDADIEQVVADLARAMFSFSGQRCTAVRRVIAVSSIAGRLRRGLVEAVESLRIGPPSDRATQIGPVIDLAARDRLVGLVRCAVDGGAKLLAGGSIPRGSRPRGAWMAPTLLDEPATDCPSWTQESFGPVAVLAEAEDFAGALRLHNSVGQGLLGVLYTRNRDAWVRFQAEAKAGILSLNRARPRFDPALPFGGWKTSGIGPPEHGRWDRDFLTRTQSLYEEDTES